MLCYSATISKSSGFRSVGCAIAQVPDSNYAEIDIPVTLEPHLSPKTYKLALGVFIKVVDIFLHFKMDTLFDSFEFGMREFWLDLCSIFKLKFQ